MQEKIIQKKILDYLKQRKIYARKIITANKSGTPDILCCVNGKFTAIEVKSPGNEPTPLQKMNFLEIEQSGGTAICVDSFLSAKNIIDNICN